METAQSLFFVVLSYGSEGEAGNKGAAQAWTSFMPAQRQSAAGRQRAGPLERRDTSILDKQLGIPCEFPLMIPPLRELRTPDQCV